MPEFLKIQSKSVQRFGVSVQAECISYFCCLSVCIMALPRKSTVKREELKIESSPGCTCVDPVVGGGHLCVRCERNVAKLEAAYGND